VPEAEAPVAEPVVPDEEPAEEPDFEIEPAMPETPVEEVETPVAEAETPVEEAETPVAEPADTAAEAAEAEKDSFVGLQPPRNDSETPEPPRNDSEAPAKAPRRGWRGFWRGVLVLLFTLIALAALAVIAFILLDQFAPRVIDRLLYSTEQLKILYS
jgi:hypothetical protein